jgi:PAS domain S-box-containing protein
MTVATADGPGGLLFRLLLPAAILAPAVIGLLIVQGQQAGYYSAGFGTAMYATANVVIFSALILWTARSVQDMEAVRRRAEGALLESESRLRTVLDSALSAVIVIDASGRIVDWNARAEKVFGWRRDEAIGQELAGKVIPERYRDAHHQGLRRFLATGEGPVLDRLIEITALRSDGSEFPVELSISPIRTGAGVLFCGFVTDITERRRAAQALVAERTLLRTLIDALPDVVFTKDAEGRFSMCNAAELKHLGLAREEDLLGKSVFDLYPRNLAEIYHADDLATLAGQSVLNREEPSVDASGNQRWYLTTKVPLHDRTGKVSGLVGISRDITERRQAEEAFRKGQQLLRAIIDNSPAVIYVKDLEGRYLLVNRRYGELFHLGVEAVLGKTDYDIFPEEAAAAFRAMDERVAAAGVALTEEEIAPQEDGPHSYISVKCPLRDETGRPYAVFGISTDITERKQAEEAFRKSQELLQAVADNASAIIWVKDMQGRYQLINGGYESLIKLRREEIIGKTDYEIFAKEQADIFRAVDLKALAAGKAVEAEEEALYDDGVHILLSVKAPLLDHAGKPYALFGISTDITERKHAEQRLRTQLGRMNLLDQITRAIGQRQDLNSIFQEVVRTLEDHMPIDFGCICLYDAGEESLTVTRVGAKSQALALDLALPEHARIDIDRNGLSRCVRGSLIHEPDVSEVRFPFPQRLARGGLRSLVAAPLLVESRVFGILVAARREPRAFSSGDCEFLRQLSEHVALAAHQAQLYGALQQAYDDLRQTQNAVMQQERLRALGQMASGIAHDINNAISPVALYTESLLEREPKLSARAREYLTTIQRAIDDVAQTVARMRDFYRPREPQLVLTRVDLNRVVQHVVDLTRARWDNLPQEKGIVITLQMDLAEGLPDFMGAESEIRDSLTNLIFNAVDAMPGGGTLTLRTTVLSAEAGANRAGRHVCVEVRDTGTGMDEETRRRCLEPFFTTKGERGTGLGLAMVYGMAQRHSAELEIESEAGRGTMVRLIFPASAAETGPVMRRPAAMAPERLRILLIDDDPLLIKSLRDTLEADGHVITSADGGQAGIDAFIAARNRGAPFEVVITDLGMPYVDGRKVAAAVREISPGTPVILLTGWGHRLLSENDVPPHVDRVLNKPPRLHEVRLALAELAARTAQPPSS